jgi:hypothetical protein
MVIRGEIKRGRPKAAIKETIKGVAALSTSLMRGIGGPAALVSEPDIVDGQLVMKVRLPFAFLKGRPDTY